MAKPSKIILLLFLPYCYGQFSIQGPSDGNRRAQGLKYSPDKGVEYTDQAASLRNDGFSIQGASDGNGQFSIQGATDGNSEFRIQGATDGNSEFQIHGPTDGGSQAYLHNYDPSQEGAQQNAQQGRAIQYKDASDGHRVNWRTYGREHQAQESNQQYEEPAQQRPVARRPAHRRVVQAQAVAAATPRAQQTQQQQPQQQYGSPVSNINYNPIEKVPPSIQEILQFQAQIPYVDIIPEHLRLNALSAAQEQAKKFAEEYPKQVLAQQPPQLIIEEAPRSSYRSRPRQQYQHQQQHQQQQQQHQSRERRQAPVEYEAEDQPIYQQHERRQAPQYEAHTQQQENYAHHNLNGYKRINQPPVEPQPKYSSSLPQQIQEILKYQAQLPYDVIANQISYKLDKPYVPSPLQSQQTVETSPVPAHYKPDPIDHQSRASSSHRQTTYGHTLAYFGNQNEEARPVQE